MVNLLPLSEGEQVTTMMPLPENDKNPPDLMFATKSGNVRRNALSDFSNVKANGKIAMKLLDGDSLVGVVPCKKNDDIMLSASQGKCMRFRSGDVRLFKGRGSVGVRGIRLKKDDEVIAIVIRDSEGFEQSAQDGVVNWLDERRPMLQEFDPVNRHTIPMTGDLIE